MGGRRRIVSEERGRNGEREGERVGREEKRKRVEEGGRERELLKKLEGDISRNR